MEQHAPHLVNCFLTYASRFGEPPIFRMCIRWGEIAVLKRRTHPTRNNPAPVYAGPGTHMYSNIGYTRVVGIPWPQLVTPNKFRGYPGPGTRFQTKNPPQSKQHTYDTTHQDFKQKPTPAPSIFCLSSDHLMKALRYFRVLHATVIMS